MVIRNAKRYNQSWLDSINLVFRSCPPSFHDLPRPLNSTAILDFGEDLFFLFLNWWILALKIHRCQGETLGNSKKNSTDCNSASPRMKCGSLCFSGLFCPAASLNFPDELSAR